MKVVDYPGMSTHNSQKAVVAIGNFDGVHKGHKAIIAETKEKAKELETASALMTFEPHPLKELKPGMDPFLIHHPSTKLRLIAETHINSVFQIHFSKSLSLLTGEQFVKQILIDAFAVSHIVVGSDFVFGHQRTGNVELLRHYADQGLFGISVVQKQGNEGQFYSSSHIRHLLVQGYVALAAEFLGRPYFIEGNVTRGDQRGREIGFPTANIELGDILHPKLGVYAVRLLTDHESRIYQGVANLGIRPTFEGQTPRLEVHLFDVAPNFQLYDKQVRVELLDFIRPEEKFESVAMLKKQIEIDCKKAKSMLEKDIVLMRKSISGA